MGDVGDDWRAFNEESRQHRAQKQEWSKELLTEWCTKNGVSYSEIQPWHIRLEKKWYKVDVYPQRQRAFYHFRNRWVTYKNLIQFVENAFIGV